MQIIINLNPNKYVFLMHSCIISGHIISKEGKLLDPKTKIDYCPYAYPKNN
jgi:hypothetical protein